MFVTAHPSLEECLVSTDEDSKKRLEALFVDPLATSQQGGKLKVEGVYSGMMIRGNKTYELFGDLDPDERRMRGVSRTVQGMLTHDHYGQDSLKNQSVVNTVSIKPTPGFEIVLVEESKKISHSFNFKRRSIVRNLQVWDPDPGRLTVFIKSPGSLPHPPPAVMSSEEEVEEEEEEEEEEDDLERHFLASAKKGVILNLKQLTAYAKKKRLNVAQDELRRMRYKFKFSAFASRFRRPLAYMSSSIQKYGLWFLDVAIYEPGSRRQNKGCGAFLIAVESLSQQLLAFGCQDGTQASWEKAVVTLARTSNAVRCVLTDRDSAIKSKKWRDGIKERFGISWIHLKSRSKR